MMTNPTWTHVTVLLQEAIAAVLTDLNGIYLDATYGRGGHSRLLLSQLSPQGRLIAFDRDPEAIADAQILAKQDPRFSIRHAAFSTIGEQSDLAHNSIAGILMDLGISSPQVDNAARGFSFMRAGPLDMRMDSTRGESVAQWLMHAKESQIAQVIHDYGEERHARRIATAIVDARQNANGKPSRAAFTSTLELAQIVAGVVKNREAGQHPATRTFQAFRIFINDELGELQRALASSLELLEHEGRLAVISFHSLEDRIVKQFIASHSKEVVDRRSPASLMAKGLQSSLPLRDLGRIKPSVAEIKNNPRSRSAVMRIASRARYEVIA
jgi:16S rRNA (cytosine1402-N4)-methyltransferase